MICQVVRLFDRPVTQTHVTGVMNVDRQYICSLYMYGSVETARLFPLVSSFPQ